MREVLSQIQSILRSVWRYRWYIHLIAWPLCIGGWLLVYKLPNEFEASARVYVDTQSVLRPLLQGIAVQTNVAQEIQIMTRTLLSRPNLEKVARMTDMDLRASTPKQMEDLIDRLGKTIKLLGQGKENLYTITYMDKDPQTAKQVVQSLLTIFVESTLGDKRKDTDVAQAFLDQQIKEYEQRLQDAENRLKEFKQKNVGLMPADGKGYYANLQNATAELEQAKLNLEIAINERDEIKRQLTGEEPNFGIVAPAQKTFLQVNPELQKRINDMQSRLDNLLLSYTEEHPDVVSVRRVLKELEEQKQKELELLKKQETATPKGLANTSLETNPVYQEMKIALGKAEANVAGLSTLVSDRKRQVEKLRTMVDTVPEIEAELARLNRGYETNKSNYEELVSRRESARIADEAEQSADNVKFKVIDPPRVPLEPAAPNRLLFSTVVLGGGILAGIVFAFFLTQIRPTFDDYRTVQQVARVPVIGQISLVRDARSKLKNRIEMISFTLVLMTLVAMYGAYVWYLFYTKTAAANLL